MSRENVEVVRRVYQAYNEGDMDAMLAELSADIEYVSTGAFPGLEPVYEGHDAWRRFWREFRGAWDSLTIRLDELHDCGDRVATTFTFDARGRDGVRVTRRFGNVITLRSGRVCRIEAFANPAEALEAVGLRD
jgi:ketosteroid isomerase-like protein